jgi:HK97 family phage prohead protease
MIERRAARVELRSGGGGLVGIAAPYGQWAPIGHFREKIERGAFARALTGGDILLLADHDASRLLARSANGSLVLDDRPDGLHFAATLPDTSAARDTLELARSGLLGGASIGFHVGRDLWNADRTERTLLDVELVEISCISATPAYSGTQVLARSRQQARRKSADAHDLIWRYDAR